MAWGGGWACGGGRRCPPPPPHYRSVLPLRLATPLPPCCTLASARWIFLAVPILLPPVRAVLEPAKWLSFKPRAAGRASAKPSCPPQPPPLLQPRELGLHVILSPAVSWAVPSPPHRTPNTPLQLSPVPPRPQSPWAVCRVGHKQGCSQQLLPACLSPVSSPAFQSSSPHRVPWGFPAHYSPESSLELRTVGLSLGLGT